VRLRIATCAGKASAVRSGKQGFRLSLRCPICASAAAEEVEYRQNVPIAQNLMFRSRAEALACPVGTLRMVRCMVCGFAWNAAFEPALLRYGADYENDQSHSPAFARHLDAVARRIGRRMAGRRDISVLEVGCGQGDFLHRLAAVLDGRARDLVGFDPAYRRSSPPAPSVRFDADSFNEETRARLNTPPDLVVARHVIEHVEDPLSFLRTLRSVCAVGVPLFVETPDVQWTLDGAVAHDLYYEHCSLFDSGSLRFALQAAGFAVEDVAPRFGGQYLLATAVAAADVAPALPATRPSNANFQARKAAALDRLAAALRSDAADGEIVAFWGGASKSVTLALLLGEALAHVEAAIDINPERSGTFMPVTALPVVPPEAAQAAGITKAYVANPQYLREIELWCRRRGWPLKLASIE